MRIATLPAAAVLLLSGCAYSMIVDGQLDPVRLQALTTRTAAARGLPVPEQVPARSVTQHELRQIFQRIVAEEYTEQEIADREWTLVTLGLWPSEKSYVEDAMGVVEEEVAGLYVPDEGTLYVVEDVSIPWSMRAMSAFSRRDFMREWVVAHELVHLFQHRAYPQLFAQLELRDQNDLTTALQAAIEGDATRYGFSAVLPEGAVLPPAEILSQEMEADLEGRSRGALAESPALTRLTLAFPYSRGYGLSIAEGKQLLDDPPSSTEQVLHAERRGEAFWAVDLAPLAAKLPASCRVRGHDSAGELIVSVLFRDLREADAEDPAAWEGWDGDRFLAAECDGSREFLWWTQWDSEADATEFAEAYREIAEAVRARAGLAAAPRIRKQQARVLIFTEGLEPQLAVPERLARRARVAASAELLEHFATETAEGD